MRDIVRVLIRLGRSYVVSQRKKSYNLLINKNLLREDTYMNKQKRIKKKMINKNQKNKNNKN